MSVAARCRLTWRRIVSAPELPEEIEAALVRPLYTRVFSLLMGHVTGLCLCALVMARVPALWPAVFMAALLGLLGARAWVILLVWPLRSSPPAALLRWRKPYEIVGLAWALVSAAFCCLCVAASGDEVTRVLAIALVLGSANGIASRNAGTPRFAMTQLCIWLLPLIVVATVLGSWYPLLSLMVTMYLPSLCSIVRQHYADMLSLIGAERHEAALASRFNAAISNMTQGLVLFDAGGLLQIVNRRFCELFALPQDALRPGITQTEFAAACAAGGAPRGLVPELSVTTPDKGTRTVLDLEDGRAFARSQEILPDGGRVITFEDMTESRRAQLALAERESELRTIFENAAAGVTEMDFATGRLVRVNRVFCEMVGWSEADLLGRLPRDALTHPDDRGAAAERWSGASKTGQAYDAEKRYLRSDGSVVWARISASVSAFGRDGRPLRMVAILTDMTARKAAEAALRASQEILRMSLDIGRIGSFRLDHRADMIHCGPETRQMHGFPPSDEPLSVAAWSATWLPEERDRIAAELAAIYAERRTDLRLEYRFQHPVLGIRNIEGRARIEYDDAGLPIGSVGVAIDITERRVAEARIAHLAHHDPLTDLPNRTLFRIRLEEALARARRGEHFAVCCLDLDHFKDVNDALGHPVGDALLQAATERLKAALRPTDTVARLGGDEFAVIQSSLEQPADAKALAERLIASLAPPFEIEGHHVVIGTSVGIAVAPEDGVDPDLLMRNADLALYGAKADGRGRYRFFEPEMNHRMQARRALELDLRRALEADEFELMYQPLVSVATRTVCGFEALLRWRHPTRGLVLPDRFVPLAEAIGLIVPIGAWVLHRACAEAATWPGAPRVAVNLSAVQFTSDALVDTVAAALRDSGLDPQRLELEITETAMLQDTEKMLEMLHRLKALGVGIAMDDFGTGYSSLSYLQRFPFDKVKIDRSFVANLGRTKEASAIVGAVIDLCAGLAMSTTAEGIETESQLAALAGTGCTEAQGYYISHPRPASEVTALIAALAPSPRAFVAQPG